MLAAPGRSNNPAMSTSSRRSESFQIPIEAAEAYESNFVPALFAEWAPVLCEAAGVGPGTTVLDVACGTGIVARTAADLAGPEHVVGCDLNEAMLTVARRVRPDIRWQQGDAAALPFPDRSFAAVVCQMALMFFPDPAAAVGEMGRVVSAAGTVAIVVPSRIEAQPAYGPFVEMAAGHAGPDARALMSAYFASGDPEALTRLFESAGLRVTGVRAHVGRVRFPSVDAFVMTEVESTPLGERIGAQVTHRIREDARAVLRPWTAPDGALDAPFEGQVLTAEAGR